MSKLGYAAVLTVIVAVQLVIATKPLMTGNPARVPYRGKERFAAMKAMEEHFSPETEAAFREELRLASRYETRQKLIKCGVLLATFLFFDGVCIYLWRHDANKKIGA